MAKAKNPFLPYQGAVHKPKRNPVDLSRQNLFTSDWGKIYPFFCQEVIPGDSFKISASIGFRAMPTKFPLQSRVRTSASFFYVRNRTLWKDWEDWIYKTKGASDGVVAPWLKIESNKPNVSILQTGGLGDALGLPTTIGSNTTQNLTRSLAAVYVYSLTSVSSWSDSAIYSYFSSNPKFIPFEDYPSSGFDPQHSITPGFLFPIPAGTPLSISINSSSSSINRDYVVVLIDNYSNRVVHVQSLQPSADGTSAVFDLSGFSNYIILSEAEINRYSFFLSTVTVNGRLWSSTTNPATLTYNYITPEITSGVTGSSPFVGTSPALPINALPFRAYEMVCNYYFRHDLNSPFMIDGQPQYNKFIPSDAGGADAYEYKFHFHNWELDRFVSSLPSPQFGAAPLVGLTYQVGIRDGKDYDTAKFSFEDGSGNTFQATLGVDPQSGEVIDIADFSQDLPASNLKQLQSMVEYGFSINTFRDVNSFQRFKENMVRRGLRYRNQLLSHAGVEVDYPDIDVPQYIGGFSSWAESGQVTNMAELPDAGLGDYVGTLSGFSQSKRSIHCYCPEHGFIIGVYSIYPTPIYSQSIDKFLLKNNPFDYFNAEFGKVGFVPIHYSEISPLQTFTGKGLTDVFGYQKAWYDYLSAYDSCHGDFRTTLRDFVIQRLFDSSPNLSEDFVRVNPLQLNDIFTTRNIADAYGSSSRFLCSAVVNCTALRPIPVHGIPSLE